MTVTWPVVAATVPDRPLADVMAYRLLSEHPRLASYDLTVDFTSDPSTRTIPWLRVQTVRYLESHRPGESTPVISIDVYGATALASAEIATRIATIWPLLTKVNMTDEGYISGAWVEVEPYRMDEPVEAASAETIARYHLEVGLRLHPPLGVT